MAPTESALREEVCRAYENRERLPAGSARIRSGTDCWYTIPPADTVLTVYGPSPDTGLTAAGIGSEAVLTKLLGYLKKV